MISRLHNCVCVFILHAILQSSIGHVEICNDTYRTKRETSVAETSELNEDTNYMKQINLEHEKKEDDSEEKNIYQDNSKEKYNISDYFVPADIKPLDTGESFKSNEKLEELQEKAMESNKATNNLIRLPRNINHNLNEYTDQDGESSLYDDYETKDVAKREVLDDSEDYDEIEDESPEILEDNLSKILKNRVVVQEPTNKAEKKEDFQVKRDQDKILEVFKSGWDNSPKKNQILEGSRTETNNMKLKDLNKVLAFDNVGKIKDFELKDGISKLNYFNKSQEPITKITSSDRVESNAEYENRVEEAIQRKIDALKAEIQRDIKAQQQIKDIEYDNARFDELQDQEYGEDERSNFKEEPIEKRQIVIKRFTRKIANDPVISSNTNEKKKSLKTKQCFKPPAKQPIKLNTLKNKNLNKRFVIDDKSFKQISSKVLSKKKREPSRQVFLVNNQHEAKKRQSRCCTLPSKQTTVKSDNILLVNPKSNSDFYTDNRMVSLPDSEATTDEEERSFAAKHSDSLEALTGSFQELSPRLEKDYKEAFGGLQSEPKSALARFKRIKRVLDSPDAKI